VEIIPQATVTTKPDHREEREVSRKTIARGMPDESGEPLVTILVCFHFFACEAVGASSARHSPRPLNFRWLHVKAKLARITRRQCAGVGELSRRYARTKTVAALHPNRVYAPGGTRKSELRSFRSQNAKETEG
jgi:hypothetical protein